MTDTSNMDASSGRSSDPPDPYLPVAPRPDPPPTQTLPDLSEDDDDVTQPNLPPILAPGTPAQWT